MAISMDADLPKDPSEHLDKGPEVARHIHRISAEDREYSLSLRKGGKLTAEDYAKEFSEQQARAPYVKALTKQIRGEALTDDDLQAITKNTIEALGPDEKGRLVNAMLKGNMSPAAHLRTAAVIASLGSNQLNSFASTLTLNSAGFKVLFRAAANQGVAPALAESVVRDKLRSAAKTIKDPDLRGKYLDENISDRDLIDVLAHVSPKTRLQVLQTLLTLSEMTEDLDSFIKEKIDNALCHCESTEKIALLKHILSSDKTEVTNLAVHGVLRSAKDIDTLVKVVNAVSVDKLLELDNSDITNLVAYAVLHPKLEKASLPKSLSLGNTALSTYNAYTYLEDAITERMIILRSDGRLTDTQMVREYLAIGGELVNELSSRRSEARGNSHRLRYAHNIVLEKMDLAFRYGVNAADSQTRQTIFGDVIPGVKWELSELAEVREALDILPELRLLDTPNLTTIERVKDLGRGVMGARYPDGTIRIADFAVNMKEIEEIFPGYSSLTAVLVHELLHGIQLGASGSGVKESESGELSIEAGERIIDFDEFTKISGWTPIAEDRWDPVHGGRAIKLDGEVYHLNVPVVHQGKDIIITYSRGTVYTRKAYAGFSLDLYSTTNPWEDYAETATEYFLAPERLIELSPEKFQFFEQEFGMFKDREDLKKLLEESLKKYKEKYGDRR